MTDHESAEVALSFRLDPSFLPAIEYPIKPYGIIFIVGSDFRGFHVRFGDVARGGIRIVRSRGKEDYGKNARTLFDENYGLAATQNLKWALTDEQGEGIPALTLMHKSGTRTSRSEAAKALFCPSSALRRKSYSRSTLMRCSIVRWPRRLNVIGRCSPSP